MSLLTNCLKEGAFPRKCKVQYSSVVEIQYSYKPVGYDRVLRQQVQERTHFIAFSDDIMIELVSKTFQVAEPLLASTLCTTKQRPC